MTRDTITISTICRKGGVGKTTMTANIAAHLSEATKSNILVIDCDGQNSLTSYYLKDVDGEKLKPEQTTAAFFDDSVRMDPNKMIHKSHKRGLHIVPANEALSYHGWPNIQEQPAARRHSIRNFIAGLKGHFEFVIIDTGPTLRTLPNWAALVAADYVFCPVMPQCFSGLAIAPVQRFIKAAQADSPNLHMLGFALNLVDKRYSLHQDNEQAMREYHGDAIFETITPRLVDYQAAIDKRVPITEYNRSGDAAKIADALTKEIYTRILKHETTKTDDQTDAGKEAA